MNPSQTCREWADELAAAHEDFYRVNPKGELRSAVIIEAGDGHYEVVACAWANQFERAVMIAALQVFLQKLNATRYAFFGEVWMSVKPDDYARPSLDPEREEKVFTAISDRRLATPVCVSQRIVRGRSGGVRKLLRDPDIPDGIMGALADLFTHEGETLQ
jgi:hypothetical protein